MIKMFSAIKNLFISNDKKEYRDAIERIAQGGTFSDTAKNELRSIAQKNNLNPNDLVSIHKNYFTVLVDKVTQNLKLSDQGLKTLDSYTEFAGLTPEQITTEADRMRKYYAIWQIEDMHRLPVFQNDGIPLVLKKAEQLAWASTAQLKKFKKVTNSISYGGPTASIRIAKGISYRVGSLKLARSTSEVLDIEDSGVFWLTNQRIGFIGKKKHFTFPYDKILSFDLSPDGLFLRKEGRESAYIVGMDDYELPCSVISFVLNPPEESCQITFSASSICPHCRSNIEPGWKFCPSCAKPL